ncbi:50S ribosomal protein L15 [bacterium BMS3Bbin03]|nr:50S ribosomal protein L15 [bacterium BMS3Bbin03]
MNLGSLRFASGSKHKEKRIGRGLGSGHGKTATKGHKGQRSRSGAKFRAWFEGGQMPIQRRLPKRGFFNPFRKEYQIVNVSDLERLEGIEKINPKILYEKRLVRKKNVPVKILGEGEVTKAFEVSAHAFSGSARTKIESVGGKAITL